MASPNPVLELELAEEKLPMTLSRQEVRRTPLWSHHLGGLLGLTNVCRALVFSRMQFFRTAWLPPQCEIQETWTLAECPWLRYLLSLDICSQPVPLPSFQLNNEWPVANIGAERQGAFFPSGMNVRFSGIKLEWNFHRRAWDVLSYSELVVLFEPRINHFLFGHEDLLMWGEG